MIRGTTPLITLRITNGGDLDLTEATNVYVTLRQMSREITMSGDELVVEAQSVSFSLSQKNSLALRDGEAEAQINWTYFNGVNARRTATRVKKIIIERQLLQREVE